jgi:hypothetical protein
MQISDQKGIFHPCVHGDVINKAKKFKSYTFVQPAKVYFGGTVLNRRETMSFLYSGFISGVMRYSTFNVRVGFGIPLNGLSDTDLIHY